MHKLFSHYKMYLFFAVAVLVAIGAWWMFASPPQDEELITSEGASDGLVDKEVVGTLLQLRAITLSGTIFSDPAFQALQDFGTQVIQEPVGRPNPFAPASFRSTSTQSANRLFQAR